MKTKKLALTALFSAVICILSMISIPLPFSPIPFTLSLYAIFLTGAFLTPLSAFTATLLYIAIGAVGLPVYAGMRGGVSVIVGPTGGYLVAYLLMALVISIVIKIMKKRSIASLALGMLLSLVVCYLLGTIWFCYVASQSFAYALSVCVVPFVLFDLIKIAVAIITVKALEKSGVKRIL